MTDEPSLLDYVKSLLTPWRGAPLQVPIHVPEVPLDSPSEAQHIPVETASPAPQPSSEAYANELSTPAVRAAAWPWRGLIALGLALVAQRSLEPTLDRAWLPGAFFYILAIAWTVWAERRGEWRLAPLPEVAANPDSLAVQRTYVWVGGAFAVLAFSTLGGNRFTSLNVFLWLMALVCVILGFWQPGVPSAPWMNRIRGYLPRDHLRLNVSGWTLLLLLAAGLVIFFRVYRLNGVPPEMLGDHAEKLLDVWDVNHGQTHIFFPRNTGREGLQMYLTAAVINLFGTGYSFLSLKIGTAIAGLATLPFIYLLGKELGSRRAGLLALALAGVAYWPNVITRIGLRFTLYPLFVAPTLYFLIRGLRRSNRNDFILAGLSLGIGLHGYTPIRILPFVIVVAVGLFLLHRQSAGVRKRTLIYLALLALIALIVFLPLLRFWIENPELFGLRAFSRLGPIEQPLPGPAWQIFLKNLWNAVIMFAWSNGEIWPVSIPYRPALDVFTGALFYTGVALLLLRYIIKRNWEDLFLVLSVPMLMLPSILSLAFPSENPALNRAAGALVPVFLIAGLSLDGLMNGFEGRLGNRVGRRLAWGFGILLVVLSTAQNYDLVFNQYQRGYTLSSWNTTEIGEVIRSYVDTIGSEETAYVVAYPYWVDTRLVGMNGGFPTKDTAIAPENLSQTLQIPPPKLFVIHPEDANSIQALQLFYPHSYLQLHESRVENKDFYLFLVLPED
ncbi:MAG TPA: glycosyltransferase family 39 protein [Anaerolineales bacterium]|nr:glycosyltransferase family 39 protein [Anaerolineales bacterium]